MQYNVGGKGNMDWELGGKGWGVGGGIGWRGKERGSPKRDIQSMEWAEEWRASHGKQKE